VRILALLPLALVAGCAGYAIDYTKKRSEIIGPQLARYGLDPQQQACVAGRLEAGLTVWQTRQLEIVAGSIPNGFYQFGRLTPADLAWAARNTESKAVAPAFEAAAAACGVSTAPPMQVASAPVPATPPVQVAPPPATWVSLGIAGTGQAIFIDRASAQRAEPRQAWFRVTNPGQAEAGPVAYLLRMDCQARTINPMAARRLEGAQIAEERNYGPNGEGALPVEAGTVMELAWRSLCQPS
jgi:hypothetical protein